MFRKAKYIVYYNNKLETEDIVVFTFVQKHSDVAKQLPGAPISAGFISFYNSGDGVQVMCEGESDSLNLKSRTIDTDLVTAFLLGE